METIHSLVALITNEYFAILVGLIAVYLAARNNVWTWPLRFISALSFALVFYEAKEFDKVQTQLVFAAVSLYGLVYWLIGSKMHKEVPVRYAGIGRIIVLGLIFVAIMPVILVTYPYKDTSQLDAVLIASTVLATYMLARRYVESWVVWILFVNIPYALVYLYEDHPVVSVTYAALALLSVVGWVRFKSEVAYNQQVEGSWASIPL